MKMIIFLNDRKKALKLSVNLWGCLAALAAIGALSIFLSNLIEIYLDKRAVESEMLALEDVKADTRTAMNAMVGRVSLLQSHVMRLDALGSRLAEMAQVDDFEFGIEYPPGLGGPHNDLAEDGTGELSDYDFLISLNRLEHALQDRQDKLTAMETMLMGRSLNELIVPQGNPAKGGWFSSLFGYRTNPITGREEFHLGVDLAGRAGTAVTSIASGIVTWSGRYQAYGNLVEISHGNGYVTRYAHNKENLVNVGERVEKGQVIAVMGSTGRSTGTHVHFEVVKNGRHINPRNYISLN